MATTGERIRDARKAKGMTQGELAEKIGVKTPAVYKYESGFSLDTITKFCEKTVLNTPETVQVTRTFSAPARCK